MKPTRKTMKVNDEESVPKIARSPHRATKIFALEQVAGFKTQEVVVISVL
jgi:hypothetical protein